jgi:DNA repair protein RecO (recombination protein O)
VHIESRAIVCSVLAHGEHGAVARVFTPDNGLQAGYVRGGRSRRLKPVLIAGNLVEVELRARTDAALAAMTVELTHSRALLLSEPLPAAAIDWVTAFSAAVLPEGQPYPLLFEMLDGVLGAIESAPAASGWAVAMVRYEQMLLAELGFGLDLTHCAITGAREGLAFVSPKSGAAVTAEGGAGYEDRLFPLPAFMLGQRYVPDWQEIIAALRITGHFLEKDILRDRRSAVLVARERLIERLKRLV